MVSFKCNRRERKGERKREIVTIVAISIINGFNITVIVNALVGLTKNVSCIDVQIGISPSEFSPSISISNKTTWEMNLLKFWE